MKGHKVITGVKATASQNSIGQLMVSEGLQPWQCLKLVLHITKTAKKECLECTINSESEHHMELQTSVEQEMCKVCYKRY